MGYEIRRVFISSDENNLYLYFHLWKINRFSNDDNITAK